MSNENFLQRIQAILDKQAFRESFGVTELADEICLSRSQLHRKIHALTGKSASQLIKEHRLLHAQKLLLSTELTVAEIAYQVGFKSPTYFNSCYKDHFNLTPGEARASGQADPAPASHTKKQLSKSGLMGIAVFFLLITVSAFYFTGSTNDQEADKNTTKAAEVAFTKGRHLMYQFTAESFEKATTYYYKSLAIDTTYTPAYIGLAEINYYSCYPRISKERSLKAEKHARQALDIEPGLSEGHRILGMIYYQCDWHWKAADEQFQLALENDVNNCVAQFYYSHYQTFVSGQLKDARKLVERAKLACPLFIYHYLLSAEQYIALADYDLALAELSTAIEIDSNEASSYWLASVAYQKQKRMDEAVEALVNYCERLGLSNEKQVMSVFETGGLSNIYHLIIEEMISQRGEWTDAYMIAKAYALNNDEEQTLTWLNKAYDQKIMDLSKIKYDFHFQFLHSNPEFLNLLTRMNLGKYDSTL